MVKFHIYVSLPLGICTRNICNPIQDLYPCAYIYRYNNIKCIYIYVTALYIIYSIHIYIYRIHMNPIPPSQSSGLCPPPEPRLSRAFPPGPPSSRSAGTFRYLSWLGQNLLLPINNANIYENMEK